METISIISYTICSLIYFLLLTLYIFRYPSIVTTKTRTFKVLFMFTLVGLILNMVVEMCNVYNNQINYYALVALNSIYLIIEFMIPAIYFLYSLACKNKITKAHHKKVYLLMIPEYIIAVLLLGAFFSDKLIFYVAKDTHEVIQGPLFPFALVILVGYSVAGLITALSNKNSEPRVKIAFASLFIGHAIVGTLKSLGFGPSLTDTANAVTLVILFFLVESYESMFYHEVNTFNEKAARMYLDYLTHGAKQHVSVFFAHLMNTDDIISRYQDRITIQYRKAVVARLKKIFGKTPIFYIAGNTFLAFIPEYSLNTQHLQEYHDILNSPMEVQGIRTQPLINVSFIKYDERYRNTEILNTMIDEIIYEQKHSYNKPENQILVTDRQFYEDVIENQHLLKVVNEAINNNTIEVYYQPIVASDEKRIKSLEALARLKDPLTGKFINSEKFIHLAESNGSISILGEQVFTKVIQLVSTGKLQSLGVQHVSVNLSMKQCIETNIAQRYLEIAQKYNVDPDFIILEITESAQIKSLDSVKNIINSFVSRGFRFALDDFGTGYSNFAYILELPVSTIKIDKSVLYKAFENDRNNNIFHSIVQLITNMKVASVVEGVENPQQAKYLEDLGLYRHQGWLYSKALPVDKLFYFLLEYNSQEFGKIMSKTHGMGKNRIQN